MGAFYEKTLYEGYANVTASSQVAPRPAKAVATVVPNNGDKTDPQALGFMPLKRWMAQHGFQGSELRACSGTGDLLRLLEAQRTAGLVSGQDWHPAAAPSNGGASAPRAVCGL